MATFNDKQIGTQAAGRLSAALRGKTRSFTTHYNGGAEKLVSSKAVARFKTYGLTRNGTKSTYLRAISIRMPNHGYILHYGADINRNAGSRTRNRPKNKTYHFKNHMMKQRPRPFLDEVIQRSRVVEFVSEKIAENRSSELAETLAVSIRSFT